MNQEHPRNPTGRPLVIFDGDCGFCRRWIDRWRQETGDAVDYAPYQEVASAYPSIPIDSFRHAVHFVDVDGNIHRGAAAVFSALAVTPLKNVPLFAYRHVPGFRPISELIYRWVASHRPLTDRLTLLFWGRDVRQPSYRIAADFFLRGLGLVYLIAFLSLAVQVLGLIGSSGILPASGYLDQVRRHFGERSFWIAPTLAWFNSGDSFLLFLCGGGAMLGALAIAGVLQFPALALAWLFYLSLAVAGQDFTSFQWDSLLLETGLFALFIAPLKTFGRIPAAREPSRFGLFMLRWLLFRLMFSSGLVKLTSGDATWHNLTALQYHYETQCLPTWIAWYAHQLPVWFQKFSVLVMFAIELVLPFLMFLPRNFRRIAFLGFVFLQVLIILTGNYTFFNLLTLVLCLLLVDDTQWGGRFGGADEMRGRSRTGPIAAGALGLLSILSLIPLGSAFRKPIAWPGPMAAIYEAVQPFRSLNGYGLFSVMTTSRSEIIIEGSRDGTTWTPYEFRWKPGDPARRPGFVAPHQPRLDWQMWFAALGDYRRNPWVGRLMSRLFEGSRPVLGLLDRDPFDGSPPEYIRARLYDYHFTTFEERQRTGNWWTRKEIGPYGPTVGRRAR